MYIERHSMTQPMARPSGSLLDASRPAGPALIGAGLAQFEGERTMTSRTFGRIRITLPDLVGGCHPGRQPP
ncbi:hypothetical protein [Kitasatospora aureofaciens]|uniref:hypothetical protein n=1 Tax=Kitasatospora aureofaciens TaxID=1894 RepID=UPI001C46BFC0|nr:hypothetical protein [Kitasatospora aureofaciens]MBV6696042.1 hypothetical protein [Kitasatospora aureofaciens]